MSMNVRLASQSDCKELVDLLQSEKHEKFGCKHLEYTNQSIQNYLSNNSTKIFVSEDDGKLAGAAITSVVDAGTSLVIKDVHIEEAYNDSELVSVLLTGVYSYMGSNFRRLRRERFVSSSENLVQLFDKLKISSGKFSKVFQLDQQEIEIEESGGSFGKKLDSLVRSSCLLHMTRKEADLYILRNLSCFSGQTLIVDSVPYKAQLSNTDTIFSNGEYLMGEKQSDQRDLKANSSLRVPSPLLSSSGRNSPTRLHSSHMVNVLDSLHSSLRNMKGSLQGLHISLQEALPKSFSHGKQQKTQLHKTWEATIYSKDSEVFRAHALEQLRTASFNLKTNFTFIMNYHSDMTNEAKRLFIEELGFQFAEHATRKLEVYERPFEFSHPNGLVQVK